MPVMDGFEFKKNMDLHHGKKSIPVIVFTANQGGVPQGMEVAHVMNKSAPLDKILDAITRHLTHRK